MHASARRSAITAAFCLALAGCATTVVDSQWRSVELPAAYLRGTAVMVSCETHDDMLRRICEDQVAADLARHGVTPVFAAPGTVAAAQPGVADAHYLPAARALGATAVLSVTVGASSTSVSPGMMVSVGGFGFGRHSAGGVGVAAPVGGGQVSNGYSANGRVTDVATGRMMWAARASTAPSSDVNAQLSDLSRTILDAAGQAGLF
jgi:hypothetical protein